MSKPSKSPARKTTKPTAKKDGATKENAVKDAPTAPKAPAAPTPRDPRLPAPGTTATRPFKGKSLRVKYLEDGVEVDGKQFDSLSAAARHVTGAASINGFLFFGLTQPKPPRAAAAAAASRKDAKAKKPAEPKIGNGNDLATAAGQRAALAAVGLAKKPAAKSTPSTRGATK